MKRTSPITLIVAAVSGGAIGWLLEVGVVASGVPLIVPPASFALALAVFGVLVVALALPVRRAVRDREHHRVDPFYATRVVLLAKASSLAGALLTGAAFGMLVFLLTRSVLAAVGSIVMVSATVVGAVVLVIGGLVAEHMCSIPPDDGENTDDGSAVAQPQ